MIVSKTPLRMSFAGGGSDLPSFYKNNTGAVLSTSINKYMYICVNKKFDGRIRLNYSKTEDVLSINEIEHPLVREALDIMDINAGIEIASMADIPSKGSGLGSSSSYTVGLLNALSAYKNNFISKEDLAKKACEIEIERCGEPIGKQDQYAAAYGGLNLIQFHSNNHVTVDPIICSSTTIHNLEKSILIFYTNQTRSASKVLKKQSEEMKNSKKREYMCRMVEIAFKMKTNLESGNLDDFGSLLDDNWRLKSLLTNDITNSVIDNWYAKALKNGALGGKLLGAGNGGFLMFFAPPSKHNNIKKALSELQCFNFGFDKDGSKIIYYNKDN